MSLRIIAGRLGGRRVEGPSGDARPTTGRVREALFSILETRMALRGAGVLDLFSGTGALAFEAISRGADTATLVERDPPMLNVARRNAEALGIESACRFEKTDVYRWLEMNQQEQPFDLILADPSYHDPGITRLPELARSLLSESGLFALEHKTGIAFEDQPGHILTRRYGGTSLSLFRKKD